MTKNTLNVDFTQPQTFSTTVTITGPLSLSLSLNRLIQAQNDAVKEMAEIATSTQQVCERRRICACFTHI